MSLVDKKHSFVFAYFFAFSAFVGFCGVMFVISHNLALKNMAYDQPPSNDVANTQLEEPTDSDFLGNEQPSNPTSRPSRLNDEELENPSLDIVDENTISITMEAWADNWFAMYIDDELIIEDSVSEDIEKSFNSERITFDTKLPANVNFILKDYKEDDTGLEYIGETDQKMGDGGFIAQFRNAETDEIIGVTDREVKCLPTHVAPLKTSCVTEADPIAGEDPCEFEITEEPEDWLTTSYLETRWERALEYLEEAVNPKGGYDSIEWDEEASFIWGDDIEKVNTLLCKMELTQ